MKAKATQTGQIQISELTPIQYETLQTILEKIYEAKIILNSYNDVSIAVLKELYIEKFAKKLNPTTNAQGYITMTWKTSQVMAFRKIIGGLNTTNQYTLGFLQDISYKFAEALLKLPSITAPSLLQSSSSSTKQLSDGR